MFTPRGLYLMQVSKRSDEPGPEETAIRGKISMLGTVSQQYLELPKLQLYL
jgi:hypothetical protein